MGSLQRSHNPRLQHNMLLVPVALGTLSVKKNKTKQKQKQKNKAVFLNFLEFYSRWKGLYHPQKTKHASNLLQFALCNFYSYSWLSGLACRCLWNAPGAKMSPKSCFWGRPPSDMTVVYHLLAYYSAPTTSGEVFRPLCTKCDLLTLPRD